MIITNTYVDLFEQPTWVVDGKQVRRVAGNLVGTMKSKPEMEAIRNLIQALAPGCHYQLFGFMPPCVLQRGHAGAHQDEWGGYYGTGDRSTEG